MEEVGAPRYPFEAGELAPLESAPQRGSAPLTKTLEFAVMGDGILTGANFVHRQSILPMRSVRHATLWRDKELSYGLGFR